MQSARVPKVVRDRFGDDATFGLLEMFDSARAGWSEQVLNSATERFERRLTQEVSGLREELLRALHEGLTDVHREIATTRFELLKWSFLFWVGQVAAMAGLFTYMLRGAGR